MQVFISYKRQDEPFARRLHEKLQSWSYTSWLDVVNIEAGDDWDSAIHEGLKAAEIVIGVLTPESLASDNVLDEWGYALSTGKRLFLLWLRNVPEADIPPRYIRIQRIDLRQNETEGLGRLEKALGSPVKILAHESISVHEPPKKPTVVHAPPNRSQDRNRERLLQKVLSFWVEGVLEKSVYREARLELGMEQKPQAVDNPWDTVLQHLEYGDYRLPPDTSISDVFQAMNGELLILGEPGSGKTTTLLELARDLIHKAIHSETEPIPVVFNLSSWSAERKPLEAWLADELNTKYQVPKKVAQDWIEEDQLTLLLDGLDEVNASYRNACVEAINRYRGEHTVDLVVCSRIADYEALISKLRLQGAVVLQALTPEQVDTYLAKFGEDAATVRQILKVDPVLREMAETPLMLTIITLAYRGVPYERWEAFESVESCRQNIFRAYVERMFDRKGKSERYTREETTHWLAWLAGKMVEQKQSVFYIETINTGWLDTFAQRLIFIFGTVAYFLHLTKAEMVAWAVLCVMTIATLITGRYQNEVLFLYPIVIVLGMWIMFFIMAIPASGLFGKTIAGQFHPQPLKTKQITVSLKNISLNRSSLLRNSALFGSISVFFGVIASTLTTNPNLGIVLIISLILFVPLMILIVVGSAFRSEDVDLVTTRPGEAFNRMAFRDRALYSSLQLTFYLLGNIPWNYARFLDYAAERVFLRKVGGGYIFIHRLLMEYFAELETDEKKA